MRTIGRPLFTRREALRLGGIGAGFLLSPVIAHRAWAESGKVPQRVLFIMSQNGIPKGGWQMSETGGALTLGGSFAPLNRHSSQVAVIDGIAYKHTSGHVGGSLTFLTNRPMSPNNQNDASTRAQGESLDYFLARNLKQAGHNGANLLLATTAGVDQWGGGEFITYEGPGRPVKAVNNPQTVFNRVFGKLSPTAPKAPSGPVLPAEWQGRARQSVLDFVQDEYRTLKSTLGPVEGRKLDETLGSIRELETVLVARERSAQPEAPPPACAPGQAPTSTTGADAFDKMTRVITEAMSCGETLVATVRFSGGMWNNSVVHGWSHSEDPKNPGAMFNKHQLWQAGEVATLLDRMKAKSIGSGTLLDHTLVVWGNEINITTQANDHGGNNVGLILAGSYGGRFNMGRLYSGAGLQHSAVLVSVAQGMGFAIDGFGDMTGCKPGPLPGLLKA